MLRLSKGSRVVVSFSRSIPPRWWWAEPDAHSKTVPGEDPGLDAGKDGEQMANWLNMQSQPIASQLGLAQLGTAGTAQPSQNLTQPNPSQSNPVQPNPTQAN